jgi:hypothetical protein
METHLPGDGGDGSDGGLSSRAGSISQRIIILFQILLCKFLLPANKTRHRMSAQ